MNNYHFDDFDHPDRSRQVDYFGREGKKITIDNLDTLRMFSPGYKITHWAFDDSTNQIKEVEDGFLQSDHMVLGIAQENPPQNIPDPERYTITTENETQVNPKDWLAFDVIKDIIQNKLPEVTDKATRHEITANINAFVSTFDNDQQQRLIKILVDENLITQRVVTKTGADMSQSELQPIVRRRRR